MHRGSLFAPRSKIPANRPPQNEPAPPGFVLVRGIAVIGPEAMAVSGLFCTRTIYIIPTIHSIPSILSLLPSVSREYLEQERMD